MIISKPHLLSTFEVWNPKYSTVYGEEKEWCALIPTYKVDDASPIFIVKWTQAKHLMGLRHCIERKKAQSYPITNVKNKRGGITPMYTIPLSAFEHWDTAQEVRDIANNIFEED